LSDAGGPVEVVAGVWMNGDPSVSTPMNAETLPTSALTIVFEREISVERMAVLASHVIGGRAVLPLALHMELLAHAAMHGNPGLNFDGFNDMRILNGIILAPGESRPVRAAAGKAQKRDRAFFVPVELRGLRPDGRDVPHSRAEVALSTAYSTETPRLSARRSERFPTSVEDAYATTLFHGDDLRGIVSIEGIAEDGITGMIRTAREPSRWLAQPLRHTWLADPLVLDGAFQLLILWGVAKHGEPNLPTGFGQYRQFRRAFPAGEIQVIAKIIKETGHLIRAEIEFLDQSGGLVARLQDAEFVGEPALQAQFRQNRVTVSV
jgi:hypothetical protein